MAERDRARERVHAAFVVALTGGIASGKTLVSNRFGELGTRVIDTDLIARELVQPGAPLLGEIVRQFGADILDEDGALRRRELRKRIFADDHMRGQLEAILHPAIAAEAGRRIDSMKSGYCLLVIPLLAEKGGYPGIDRVLVIDVDPSVQVERLVARDDVSQQQAEAALAAQASRGQRLAIADDVIDNSGSTRELIARVDELHRFYQYLAKTRQRAAETGRGL